MSSPSQRDIANEIQQSIIKTRGNLVVRASAGTGKTHVLVQKIVAEVEANRGHKVIAAITFTIKAAQEIRDRLTVDAARHFIGTNNSFAIEEIIKPFMKDVYGMVYDIDMDTDYTKKVVDFNAGIQTLVDEATLCSYETSTKRNFIFELARKIIEGSEACRLYLKAKYWKLYIDEYQDCDQDMHGLFMYLCDQLGIETFIVGDEKQSIYTWRGAYPEAFKTIEDKPNFKCIFMGYNHRSCQQIQNYSNLLCEETRNLYIPLVSVENIIWLSTDYDHWAAEALKHIIPGKSSSLLRYSRQNAENGARDLVDAGVEYIFVPQPPLMDVTTSAAWLYLSIAKHFILEHYSAYDLVSEIPAEGDAAKTRIKTMEAMLNRIGQTLEQKNTREFGKGVRALAVELGYTARTDHIKKLYYTIQEEKWHAAFRTEDLQHVAITFHSSKGLEFDQVILFAEDYADFSKRDTVFNHYVSSTRAKTKLIIVDTNCNYAQRFRQNLTDTFARAGVGLEDTIFFVK